MKKNLKVQVLRGLAIIAVVIIHSNIPNYTKVFIRPFINFAVALFIFLSGYLTKLEIPDYKSFAMKRLKRVIIPYVVWTVIYSIPQGFDGFWVDLMFGRSCGVFYYIFVYVQFVILTPLVATLLKSRYRVWGWLITPLSLIVFRYGCTWADVQLLASECKYLCVVWFSYYYLGMALGNGIYSPKQNLKKYVIFYVVAIAFSIFEGLVWYGLNNIDMATTQLRITSLLTSVSFLLLCYRYLTADERMNHCSKVLFVLGEYSFGIYFSHILIQRILKKLAFDMMIFPFDSIFMILISACCVWIGRRMLGKYDWVLGL